MDRNEEKLKILQERLRQIKEKDETFHQVIISSIKVVHIKILVMIFQKNLILNHLNQKVMFSFLSY